MSTARYRETMWWGHHRFAGGVNVKDMTLKMALSCMPDATRAGSMQSNPVPTSFMLNCRLLRVSWTAHAALPDSDLEDLARTGDPDPPRHIGESVGGLALAGTWRLSDWGWNIAQTPLSHGIAAPITYDCNFFRGEREFSRHPIEFVQGAAVFLVVDIDRYWSPNEPVELRFCMEFELGNVLEVS